MRLLNKKINTLLILCVSLMGCNMVESTNKVVYEDRTPVMEAQVRQYSDTVEYTTYTNVLGEWSLTLPVGSEWELCIQNPLDNYIDACYNGVLTVDINGSLNRKEK